MFNLQNQVHSFFQSVFPNTYDLIVSLMPFIMVRGKNSPTSSPIFMLDFANVLNRIANKIILKETPRASQSLLWLAVLSGESAAAGQSCLLGLSCCFGSLISVSVERVRGCVRFRFAPECDQA